MSLLRSNRYVNKNISELQDANRSPIHGYKNQMLMTLEESVEKLLPFVNDIVKYVDDAKQKCNRELNLLTWDESAAIYLYTMSTPFFSSLNDTLRAENRYALKPWFPFLKLFLNALEKLPSSTTTVWRAVSGDTDNYSLKDDIKIWWSINSSSTALNVVQIYLGERGTLFAIETIRGKRIDEYSAFPDEQEVIIMPGTFLKIESEPLNFIDLLLVVHLKEESIIHQNHENINLNLSSSTNSLLNGFSIDNMNIDDRSRLLLSENVRNMRSFSTLSKCSMIISIIFTILLPGTTFAFLIKTLFFSSSYTHSSDPFQVYTTSTRSTTTDLLDGVISTTCSHRQFHIEANILYSFDCSSFTDEIEGKYNGILTQDFWITYSEKLKGVVYISPDYSGKGSAIKFNSNTSQSIQLTRSPNLFNQSFTISFWINPNIENSSIYGLFNQIYVTAPSFNISIIEEYIVTNIYGSSLWSTKKLEKNRWQYLSLIFNKKNLSMSIYIDGIFNTESLLGHHSYGNFEITKTTCGSLNTMNTFHGLIDQLSILFEVKNPIDILNEATLVFHYNFQDNYNDNDFLFKDSSVNSIHAQGSYVSHLIDKSNHYSLSLYNSMLSYFQTENFLSTFDYSYSLWIHISNQSSSIISVLHLVTKSSSKNSTKKCLNHLIFNQTGDNKLQLSMYIYELNETIILKSNISIDYSTWFHFVFISGMNNFSLYINGNLVNLLNRTNLFKINNQQRFTLTIGNPQHQLSNNYLCYFNQTFITSKQTVIGIDDLRFYSRQLKYQEIQALYKNDLDPTKFFFD